MASSCLNIWDDDDEIDYDMIFSKFYSISFTELFDKINDDTKFSYVRFGDLEWRMILNQKGNLEHSYHPTIKQKLENILQDSKIDNSNFYISFSDKLFSTSHIHDGAKKIYRR